MLSLARSQNLCQTKIPSTQISLFDYILKYDCWDRVDLRVNIDSLAQHNICIYPIFFFVIEVLAGSCMTPPPVVTGATPQATIQEFYTNGQTVTYTCLATCYTGGSPVTRCNGGTWTPPTPICTRKYSLTN